MEDYSILTLDLLIEKLKSLREYYNCGDFIMKYKTNGGKGYENFTCDNFYLHPQNKEFVIDVEI